jgi:hypothetical protein
VVVVRIVKTTLFPIEDRGSMFLRNRYKYLPNYTVSIPQESDLEETALFV